MMRINSLISYQQACHTKKDFLSRGRQTCGSHDMTFEPPTPSLPLARLQVSRQLIYPQYFLTDGRCQCKVAKRNSQERSRRRTRRPSQSQTKHHATEYVSTALSRTEYRVLPNDHVTRNLSCLSPPSPAGVGRVPVPGTFVLLHRMAFL